MHPAITQCGVKVSDTLGYKGLTPHLKQVAYNRATKLLIKIKENRKETSILPEHMIREIWLNDTSEQLRKHYKLVIDKTFDGGTIFYIIK